MPSRVPTYVREQTRPGSCAPVPCCRGMEGLELGRPQSRCHGPRQTIAAAYDINNSSTSSTSTSTSTSTSDNVDQRNRILASIPPCRGRLVGGARAEVSSISSVTVLPGRDISMRPRPLPVTFSFSYSRLQRRVREKQRPLDVLGIGHRGTSAGAPLTSRGDRLLPP